MRESTDQLIERLAADATPVRRLQAPGVRAALWLAGAAAAASLAVVGFSDPSILLPRVRDPMQAVELAAALLTGIAAVTAAFHLSVPDRSAGWSLLPVPPLGLWLASSGYGCVRHWLSFGSAGWALGDSADCLRFILAASVPLALGLLIALRRARPLAPGRVAAVGGLGVAALAAFLLQFFHPHDVTFLDLGVHAVATAIVVSGCAVVGRWRLGGPAPA